eukprot:PhF_6_TR39941/c0_g1_i1/m.59323
MEETKPLTREELKVNLTTLREPLEIRGTNYLHEKNWQNRKQGLIALLLAATTTGSAPCFWHVFSDEKRVWRLRHPDKTKQLMHLGMALQTIAFCSVVFSWTRYGPRAMSLAYDESSKVTDKVVWDICVWLKDPKSTVDDGLGLVARAEEILA